MNRACFSGNKDLHENIDMRAPSDLFKSNYFRMKKGLFIAFLLGFLICINPGIAQKKKGAAKDQLEVLKSEFPPVLNRVKKAGDDLQRLDKQLDAIKAPWTPGRVPVLYLPYNHKKQGCKNLFK
ncbi:MAG: hypothetical protein Q7T72_07515 [Bacteroidales bacterium]|nr:hypothetical protein [Bacteroidales bacterium]